MSTMVFDGPGSAGKAVKRPRPVKSCNSCRQRKLRCDRTCPCSQCNKSNRPCKYANEHEPGPLSEGSDVEASPRPTKRPHRPAPPYADVPPPQPHSTPGSVVGGGGGSLNEQPRGVPGSVLDYFGARLERLEKFVFNPSASSAGGGPEWGPPRAQYAPYATVTGSPTTIRSLSVKGNLRTRFFGQNETRVLLNLFDEAREFILNRSRGDDIRMLFEQLYKIYRTLQEESRRALAPIPVFTDSMLPVQKRMADILPSKPICDRLLEAYIAMSEGLYRVVHVPSFKAEYESFWAQTGVSDGFLPRLMCMLSLGARFETEARGLSRDRTDGIHAPTACALARGWLDGLRGKQLVDIDTLQCEVLHLHASRMMSSRNQESWTQLGFIVRMAMTMGLHRDPDEFPQIRPFYAELRRRLWYTVVDMDLHVALACNLPCAVREGEYTCRPPSNLDDNDIFPDMNKLPPSKPIDEYTNSQLQAYASRTLTQRIRVSSIINRLDTIRDFQEVLDCGIKLEQLLDDVNLLFPRRNQTLDPRAKFKEWRMRALLDMHVRRPLLALYRPFALSTVECPSHITTSYLKSSMAAFSVCYFIKSANEQAARNKMAALNGQLPSPDAMQQDGLGFINALDNRMVWSTQGMTRAVQQTLDSFVAMVKDSSCDLKDTLILSVVLNSVKGATHEERIQRITEGIAKIVDASMMSLNTNPEAVANMPMMSGPNTPVDPYAPQGIYSPATFFDDFACWDTDQWDLSTVPVGMK
ncbi:Activator of stress genes 1 [Cytospora mali]|uniref:Activator of stress genes 1 n=1 Tax=Cytospora mali TaxID=578113 RepID=A0A194UNW6_CYTMA|nr:Activator of stress genes 1 [Valsa mali var. pyri (nom. inval.)]